MATKPRSNDVFSVVFLVVINRVYIDIKSFWVSPHNTEIIQKGMIANVIVFLKIHLKRKD